MIKVPFDMCAGRVHKTNHFGDVRVVEYRGAYSVIVEFIKSGWRLECRGSNIRSGTLKDLMQPSVCGVGFVGDGIYKVSDKGGHTDSYKCWKGMITRCYSNKRHLKQPTYKDCEVCEEWQNFQSFAEWYEINYPKDGCKYQLDKDIRISGNKTYSPEFCRFVTAHENVCKSIGCYGRVVTLSSPAGEVFKASNINQFCRDNNLSEGGLFKIIKGLTCSYKGWTVVSVDDGE